MINGIQHVGIGVRDRERSFHFYNNALGFSVPMSKSTDNCSGMLPLLGKDEIRNVIIALNPRGGALVEIFQYVSREPASIPEEVDFTYNGYLFYGLKVRNLQGALDIVTRHGGQAVAGPSPFSPLDDRGWKTAVFRDPDGIFGVMLEYPGSTVGTGGGRPRIGGIEYVAVGVSDLDRSVDFYRSILGYDHMLYRHQGKAPEWQEMFGGRNMKRALLRRSSPPQGLFKHFLRGGMIELIQVEGNTGRHNFEGRKWGDIGFMELCFDVDDIGRTMQHINARGVPTAVPTHSQSMGLNTYASFGYIRDPDRSLLEFADIKSLPVPYIFIRLLVNPFVIGLARRLRILR
jgi:catechol 2,3-dioxygenase-like lactoylglutathione lyase family enzyme